MFVEELVKALTSVAVSIVSAIPAIILALVVILLGYVIGYAARKAIKFVFDKTAWRFMRRTAVGQKFEEAGVNPGDVLGAVVTGIIVALTILLAINMLGLTGPAVEFIATFINLLIGVLGGVVVLVLGIPLAALAGEYLAKLIGLSLGDREGFTAMLQTILTILLVLFVIGLAVAVMFGASNLLTGLTATLPSAFAAGVVIIVGYIIGDLVGKAVKLVVEKMNKPLEATDIGAALKATGLDTSGLIAGLVKALIVVIAITVGLGMIVTTGVAADVLGAITFYLPRVFGALVILVLGLPLVIILSKYIGKVFKAILEEKYAALGDLVENLIAIGLIAVFVTIALNILALPGNYVYAFIIGSLVIALGVIVVDNVISILKESSPVFARMLPLVGAVFVFIIIYVGLTAILSQVIGVVDVLKIISYGIAAAMALIIIPVVFYMVRVALKEASQVESE
ncbi:MAG: mechanosensitive ion channel family protein [Desulfurococcaceae archaeon]